VSELKCANLLAVDKKVSKCNAFAIGVAVARPPLPARPSYIAQPSPPLADARGLRVRLPRVLSFIC